MIERERREIFRLMKKKKTLLLLADFFKSTKKYISRDNRNLLVDIFSFYQRHRDIKVDYELQGALLASSKNSIDAKTRERIYDLIMEVLGYFSEDITPEDDNERYFCMVDGYSIITEYWVELCGMGIVLCNVLPHCRKFEVSGTSTADQFYSSVKSRWGFINPEKYFTNYHQTSMPQGQLDSTEHITAGSSLDAIPMNYKLDGTIGGMLLADDNMYAVTAGHCVSLKDGIVSKQGMEFIRNENNMDCAVLRLHSPAGTTLTKSIRCFNPWYMDDDFRANDEYFRALRKHWNDNLLKDDETDSISPSSKEFPFINASQECILDMLMKSGAKASWRRVGACYGPVIRPPQALLK